MSAIPPFAWLGIDLGGTNIKAGVVSDAGESLSQVSLPTEPERGPEAGIRRLCEAGELAIERSPLSREQIIAVGIGAPGTMDIPAGMLLEPPNLPGWDYVPIRQLISEHFELPAILQNDAQAAAYGEYWVGAGRGANSMALWTLGTGVGCGIIVNDVIIQGEHSHGSHAGHIIIEWQNGRRCSSGQFGTLEAYCSAYALVARCEEALQAGRESVLAEWRQTEKLTPLLISRAAEAGDALAEELILDTAMYLGIGTTTLMHVINPSLFVIGGAMTFGRNETALGRRFIERVREEVRRRGFPIPAGQTPIDYATLGENAGYIGAAGQARRAFPLPS